MCGWIPAAGYEGYYWIDESLRIRNSKGKLLKPIVTSAGRFYYLRKWGQRERVFARDLWVQSIAAKKEDKL